MPLPQINPSGTAAWQTLEKHYNEIKGQSMVSWFKEDPGRADRLSIHWDNIYFDFSKNRLTDRTLELLEQLAKQTALTTAIESYFTGDRINETEGRAVLHTALRARIS